MLHKTSGIVLYTTKYSETSLIVKIISPDLGVKSYIVNGVRSKKSKFKATFFQPLSIVDMVVTDNQKSGLQRISEIAIQYPYSDIPYNIIKSSIILFLNEIIYKAVKEQQPDENMFEFIKNSLQLIDLKMDSCSNTHLFFMTEFSRYLGFFPEGNYTATTPIFDLLEGTYTKTIPIHGYYLEGVLSMLLTKIIESDYTSVQQLQLDKLQRKNILQALIKFYQLHIASFGEVKSIDVLEQIM
ncbi:MAG: DNA repair protein RecO [Bacteroidia bacterium]